MAAGRAHDDHRRRGPLSAVATWPTRQLPASWSTPGLCRTGAGRVPHRRRHVAIDLHLHVAPYSEAVVVVRGAGATSPAPNRRPSTTVVGVRGRRARGNWRTSPMPCGRRPGFAVGRNGGRGALTSVFPRGGESDYTLVLVDGIRVNSFGGGFDFSLLPLGDVEQVGDRPRPAKRGLRRRRDRRRRARDDAAGRRPTVSASHRRRRQATLRATGAARGDVSARGRLAAAREHNKSDGFTGIAPATGETVTNDDWRAVAGAGATSSGPRSATTAVRARLPVARQPSAAIPGPTAATRSAPTRRSIASRAAKTRSVRLGCRHACRGDRCWPAASSSAGR